MKLSCKKEGKKKTFSSKQDLLVLDFSTNQLFLKELPKEIYFRKKTNPKIIAEG